VARDGDRGHVRATLEDLGERRGVRAEEALRREGRVRLDAALAEVVRDEEVAAERERIDPRRVLAREALEGDVRSLPRDERGSIAREASAYDLVDRVRCVREARAERGRRPDQ